MFGMNYEEIGSKDKGLILKSSGKIKIQWGNKFIDLIDSDGNIANNSEIQDIIKSIDSSEDINEDGFYYLDGNLTVKVGDNIFSILSKSQDTYITFSEPQNLTREQKNQVQENIGFIYKTKNKNNIYPEQGIVYILDEQSLYIIKDETLKPYNPKLDELTIQGEGENHSIKLDGLKIFCNGNKVTYKSEQQQNFVIQNQEVLTISPYRISGNNFNIENYNGKSILNIDEIKFNNGNDILDSILLYHKDDEITVDQSDLTFSSDGSEQTLNITCNSVWYLENPEYGDTYIYKGIGNDTYTVKQNANVTENPINYTLIIYDIYYKRILELFPDNETLINKHHKVINITQQISS